VGAGDDMETDPKPDRRDSERHDEHNNIGYRNADAPPA
jgi:hypothetical protein